MAAFEVKHCFSKICVSLKPERLSHRWPTKPRQRGDEDGEQQEDCRFSRVHASRTGFDSKDADRRSQKDNINEREHTELLRSGWIFHFSFAIWEIDGDEHTSISDNKVHR